MGEFWLGALSGAGVLFVVIAIFVVFCVVYFLANEWR